MESAITGDELGEIREIFRQHLAGVGGHFARKIGRTEDGDAVFDDGLVGFGKLTVAAAFGGKVDDYGAGRHAVNGLGGDDSWGGLAGDGGSGDTDVAGSYGAGHQLALLLV